MSKACLEIRVEIGLLLAKCRVNSYDEKLRTQGALAKALNVQKRKISDIENGYSLPNLDIVSKWCILTRHYEAWSHIESIFGLEVLATPAIHPVFAECMVGSLSNLRKQMNDAQKAIDHIEDIWNNRRPGRCIDGRKLSPHAQQIFDVSKAVETTLYALERECGLNLHEVTLSWTQEQISKDIVMSV